MLRSNRRPRDFVTSASLDNAIISVLASAGSTNAVLHLLAIAHELDLELSLDRFDELARITPVLADLKPGGRFLAADLFRAGGVRLLMRELLAADLLNARREEH